MYKQPCPRPHPGLQLALPCTALYCVQVIKERQYMAVDLKDVQVGAWFSGGMNGNWVQAQCECCACLGSNSQC